MALGSTGMQILSRAYESRVGALESSRRLGLQSRELDMTQRERDRAWAYKADERDYTRGRIAEQESVLEGMDLTDLATQAGIGHGGRFTGKDAAMLPAQQMSALASIAQQRMELENIARATDVARDKIGKSRGNFGIGGDNKVIVPLPEAARPREPESPGDTVGARTAQTKEEPKPRGSGAMSMGGRGVYVGGKAGASAAARLAQPRRYAELLERARREGRTGSAAQKYADYWIARPESGDLEESLGFGYRS